MKEKRMHCVLCGTLLSATNQDGIVCRDCKQQHREKTVILVAYCYACGQPYHPHDASIQHRSCLMLLPGKTLPLQGM